MTLFLRKLVLVAAFAAQACATAFAEGGDDPSAPAGVHVDVTGQPVVQIQDVITPRTMDKARTDILAAAKKSGDVVLVLNSPGGEVFSGLMFINVMRQLQQAGVTFTCFVPTMAASMAFMILSECDLRYAWPDSLLLFHPVKITTRDGISAETAASVAKELAALENPLKERLIQRLGVDPAWVEYNYRAETMHRGSTLAAKAPSFLLLVESYAGITPEQLNPPKPERNAMELLFGDHILPRLFWFLQ